MDSSRFAWERELLTTTESWLAAALASVRSSRGPSPSSRDARKSAHLLIDAAGRDRRDARGVVLGPLPVGAQSLVRDPELWARGVFGFEPDVHVVKRRGGRSRGTGDVVPVGHGRYAQPGPPPLEVCAAVTGRVEKPRGDRHLGERRGGCLAAGNEVHAQRGWEYDDVHAFERSQGNARRVEIHRIAAQGEIGHAVPVHLERRRSTPAKQDDLCLAVEPAPRDVDTRDAQQQVAERLDVGQRERIGRERDARAARQRSGGYGHQGKRGKFCRRIARGRVALGAVRGGFGVGDDGWGQRGGMRPACGVHLRAGAVREGAEGQSEEDCSDQAPARFRTSSLNRRTPTAVGPLAWYGASLSV